MQKQLLTWLAVLACHYTAFTQSCSCEEQFRFFEEKVRLNYSGFRDKVNARTEADYRAFTEQKRILAASSTADSVCFRVLTEWKNWFHDGHLQLQNFLSWAKPDEIRKMYSHVEKIDFDEPRLKAYLSQPGRAPLEGTWTNADGNYKVAITRQETVDRRYAASVLKADGIYWSEGQVKFELKPLSGDSLFQVRYFMRDHSERRDTAIFRADSLQMRLGVWRRYSGQVATTRPAAPKREVFMFSMLDSTTALLVVPTMSVQYRKELDALMIKNKKLLKKTPNLIIDCRNNGGGSDITYRLITPLLYTNRYGLYRDQIWATHDNAGKYRDWQHEKESPWYLRMYAASLKRKILRNEGKFIGKKGKHYSRSLRRSAFPKRVVVLINQRCASSCESFIDIARQSKKVTLMGVNSAGIFDYGNLHTMKFPCGPLAMRYPTTRSSGVEDGKGIDGVGIPPDIRLGPEIKDWVEYARQYLHEKKEVD